jgi:high affinity choline transporter 7
VQLLSIAAFYLIAAFGCLVMAVPAVIIGAVGIAADWSLTAVGTAPDPALVLPSVFAHLTPPVVATIGLGAVAAAVMSSVDSSILSAASMFVCNLYRPLIRPTATDKESRLAVRAAVIVTGVAATGLALSVQSVYALWYLCADLVYVVLFPQLVMVLYSKRAKRPQTFCRA